MISFRSAFFALIIAAFAGVLAYAEDAAPVMLARGASGPYRFVERSDWSRYDNGKYLGHVYREVRATISPSSTSGTPLYRGDFLVLEETLRDLMTSARAVDDVIPAAFRVSTDGRIDIIEDKGFPSLRGFPAFPTEPVTVGQSWTARGVRVADPRNEGKHILIPLIAQYQYRGIEQYKGISVHRIFAKYATRYKAPTSAASSTSFVEAMGTHDADILIRAEDGLPLLIRDRMDETFTWRDGSTTRFKGFTLTFSEGVSFMDRGAVVAAVRGALGGKPTAEARPDEEAPTRSEGAAPSEAPNTASDSSTDPSSKTKTSADDGGTLRAGPEGVASALAGDFDLAPGAQGIEIKEVEEGVKLTIRDVRFVPDSDEILGAERSRIDIIANALKKAGNRTILVEGHTAAVGKPEGEMELSTRRAKRLVDELTARGIAADSFLYKGWGGERPIAPNDTEAGRAKNRRVEITILE
jgi:outer membrane protein OmpA-like peptidoglycan-associated protein